MSLDKPYFICTKGIKHAIY